MIDAYFSAQQFKPEMINDGNADLLREANWIDLLNPTKEEEMLVEKMFNIEIPTREEMQEIEISSRLYKEDDALFMTVIMVAKSDSPVPKSDAVTFILAQDKLLTLRYIEPQSFALFIARLSRPSHPTPSHGIDLLIELLETSIDRLAEILEKVSFYLNDYSQMIFRPANSTFKKLDFNQSFREIGSYGDLSTKVQESLITFHRLIMFLGQTALPQLSPEEASRLSTMTKDINSLSDHVNFLTNKITFLLDATLGMVNIEQNNIIKIFSIAAVILLPPTLVASIYGMNFKFMPELSWHYGYPFAICLMAIAAFLPYKYFKIKKWL